MAGLRAILLRHEPSDDGPQADVLFVEPDGEEHRVRCLCRDGGGTDISDTDGGARLNHLIARHGDQVILALARQVTLA